MSEIESANPRENNGELFRVCSEILESMDQTQLERYYGNGRRRVSRPTDLTGSTDPLQALLDLSLSPSFRRVLKYPIASVKQAYGEGPWISEPHSLLELDAMVTKAFETFGRDFPTAIWTCCQARCFAHMAILPEHSAVFNAILKVYRGAESLHDGIERIDEFLRTRKRGRGALQLFILRLRELNGPNLKERIAREFCRGSVSLLNRFFHFSVEDVLLQTVLLLRRSVFVSRRFAKY